MNPSDIPTDFLRFAIWALVVVCGAFASFTVAVLNWGKSFVARQEQAFHIQRQEDQKNFLAALSTRDTHTSELTLAIREMSKLIINHDSKMDRKHDLEVGEIAKLSAEAAVSKYIRDNS